MKYTFVTFLIFLLTCFGLKAQSPQKQSNEAIQRMIQAYKIDVRGPYKDIRWFCADGTTLPPKEKCADPNAVQRARYKDEVVNLANSNHVYLGQILSTTPKADFWDASHQQSRLKQYQLQKYLRSIDNGWILRKGQYYRGAFQAEDEQAWGRDFLLFLLQDNVAIEKHFFLLRQAIKDIPHEEDDNRTQRIRSASKVIADQYPAFMDLRIKIHGQPESADLPKVKAFRNQHKAQLTPALLKSMDELIADMEFVYKPINLRELEPALKALPAQLDIRNSLLSYINTYAEKEVSPARITATAEELLHIRNELPFVRSATARLTFLDLSEKLETILFREASQWEPKTVKNSLQKIHTLSIAAVGTGLIEKWEWERISPRLIPTQAESLTLAELNQFQEDGRRVVEWGTAMTHATYEEVVELYQGFEPKAYGFTDDKIRASLLLQLGNGLGKLGEFIAQKASFSNQVFTIPNQNHLRGLNPGYAMGELVVVSDAQANVEVSSDKIYVFQRPPADLKPVGGIATVTEGNMVSHVQLLARNLGIPNAVLSLQNLDELKKYSGQKVFYAVSLKGTVIMKPASQMTTEERKLFEVKKRSEEKIEVPIETIRLDEKGIVNLRNVRSSDSGKLCGPKAANLGQLKFLFPDKVVEGLVIPFGIFRDHMEQPMPGKNMSYWKYLNQIFQTARRQAEAGKSKEEVDAYTLAELAILREAIQRIPLKPDFIAELKSLFPAVLGKEMGKVPVFLRSDTNMEDLKDFSGAGLNLTLFNVLDPNLILQGIKDVWASPYTERSYKWRQNYLLNPENVFPSILIIPSVNVDHSGVMITKGISSDNANDITVAFSKGVGGAVDGQSAESYLLTSTGKNFLMAPAREPSYLQIPATGGRKTVATTFEKPILTNSQLIQMRALAAVVRQKIPGTAGLGSVGPYDMELGFLNDKLWLFQIRPFVENKKALSSTYLQDISPVFPSDISINLSSTL